MTSKTDKDTIAARFYMHPGLHADIMDEIERRNQKNRRAMIQGDKWTFSRVANEALENWKDQNIEVKEPA